jgi:hypothetical protein
MNLVSIFFDSVSILSILVFYVYSVLILNICSFKAYKCTPAQTESQFKDSCKVVSYALLNKDSDKYIGEDL